MAAENEKISKELTLDSVRDSLIRQEDSIVFALIERARFPLNPKAYEPSERLGGVSFAEFFVREAEALQAKVRFLIHFRLFSVLFSIGSRSFKILLIEFRFFFFFFSILFLGWVPFSSWDEWNLGFLSFLVQAKVGFWSHFLAFSAVFLNGSRSISKFSQMGSGMFFFSGACCDKEKVGVLQFFLVQNSW